MEVLSLRSLRLNSRLDISKNFPKIEAFSQEFWRTIPHLTCFSGQDAYPQDSTGLVAMSR